LDYNTQKSYIAVVDDEQDIVSLFREALSQIEGCTVFGFTEPEAALEHFIVNQQYYNLILTDFRMPEQNGIELLTKMNEIKPSTKALLMSAFEAPQHNEDYVKNKKHTKGKNYRSKIQHHGIFVLCLFFDVV
jgi:DNA-binding NtrC family response regulator